MFPKAQHFSSTCHAAVEKRCCTYYHPTQTLSRNKILFLLVKENWLKKVDGSLTCCNMLLQLATTKFCCVTMFEVGGNACNNAFQLATQQCCTL